MHDKNESVRKSDRHEIRFIICPEKRSIKQGKCALGTSWKLNEKLILCR